MAKSPVYVTPRCGGRPSKDAEKAALDRFNSTGTVAFDEPDAALAASLMNYCLDRGITFRTSRLSSGGIGFWRD